MVLTRPCILMPLDNRFSTGKILNSATLEQNETQNHHATTSNPTHSSVSQNKGAANPVGLSLVDDIRFTDFNISDSLKNRLTNAGFITPTPVQAKAIPPALEGSDILATASTGTGKTLSFLIPMIQRLEATSAPSTKGKRSPIRALILLPTRELAMQVLEAYWKLVPGCEARRCSRLRRPLGEHTSSTSSIAAHALSSPPPAVSKTSFAAARSTSTPSKCSSSTRSIACSTWASFPPSAASSVPCRRRARPCATPRRSTRTSARSFATTSRTPSASRSASTSKPSDRVELRVYTVMQDQKLGLLDQMLREEEGTFLVFSRTKHGADRISKKLEKLGHDADVIHGDRSQSQRTAALKGFQNGKHRVLVATDVAARGIDVQDIAHVVNYDLPNASDDFVHRIGRTGRAGAKGVATTFVMPQERSRRPQARARTKDKVRVARSR